MASEASLVQAVYAFRGTNNDELCFKKGDVITVSQREDGGWWEGTLGETTGWFPSNYVKDYRDVSGSATTSPVRAPSEIQAFRNVVLKDIIDSEKAHAAELQGLIANFLLPLEKSDIVTRDEYRQLTGNVFEVLETHEELLALVEECGAKSGPDQRVGGLFLQWAPRMKAVHQKYCASHPRAVCILDKYRDELNSFMERCGAVSPGILVLTAGLSKPFRRLDKYAAMLQELGRHVAESHPDRGDTHRAVAVYKDIASACGATRRQKELELQVVTGAVRGWQGAGGSKDLASLGEVLHMGGVALGETHADRYFVLFPSTLLILSVSRRMSAFVYEGCLPLTGINVSKLEDTEKRKNAFEINGPLIDTITAVCQSKEDAEKWVNLLSQHSSPSRNTTISTSLPHSPTQMSPTEMPNPSNSALLQGTTNHKRSHSFNNHHSYTHYLQQQQKQKDLQSDKNNWIQVSCEALLNLPKNTRTTTASLSLNNSDLQQEFNIHTFKGWSTKNLRPAPPLRPLPISNIDDGVGNSAHPYSSIQRKVNSYEEDALILRVIEAYCTSARSRNTVNSVELARISCGNVQAHTHTTNQFHPNCNKSQLSQFDVCFNMKPLNVKSCNLGYKVRRNNSALPTKMPENKKLLTERKLKLNRSNPSITELSKCDSNSPLRRSAPLLDMNPSRRASTPLLGGRGAVLLPARAPSLPLASAWCCGSFVRQLRKTHHFD